MKIYDRLIAVGSVICYNVGAENLSTFKSGGKIKALIYPTSLTALLRSAELLEEDKYLLLGNGSNTLISDEGVEENVLSLKKLTSHTIYKDGIYAMAGVSNMLLSKLARDNYFKGLEFLAGIPGSFGGSLHMNAGAFGSSIGDFVEYVDVIKNGTIIQISGQNMGFCYRNTAYRDSIFVGAKLKLLKGNPIIISNNMKKYHDARRKSQPDMPSLGSVFKRVNDMSAGYYIEKAGLSGYTIGGAEVSTKHANFIVNKGGARSSDFVELASLIEDIVFKKFGIRLQREVRYIGRGFESIR